MTQDSFSWKIGGEAGFGIVTSGAIFAKTCLRAGMSVFDYTEYPSLIRGGHNTYQLTASRINTPPPSGTPLKEENNDSPLLGGVAAGQGGYVLAPNKCVDILVALNKETITLHLKELCGKGLVLFDGEKIDLNADLRRQDADQRGNFDIDPRLICDPRHCDEGLVKDQPVFSEFVEGGHARPLQEGFSFQTRFYSVPFNRIAREAGGDEVMRNTVSLGASFAFLNCDFKLLEDVLRETFEKKPEAAEGNVKAARAGFDYVSKHYVSKAVCQLSGTSTGDILVTGNEAIGLGALSAGLKFYAAYPMTPSSSLLHYLAEKQKEFDFVVKHTEDEIAAIQHALGASFAGVRSMCGTSGGGFSLMVESVGLSGMTETPIVIMVAMRPGPATGLPTWTEQGDLRFVIHAAQGDFPRVVLIPGDAEEAFLLTRQAFEIAEKYQIPVFILSDKYLSESRMTISNAIFDNGIFDNGIFENKRFNIIPYGRGQACLTSTGYVRYPTDQVVNPRTIPGVENGIFVANSDEHDAFGASSEDANMRVHQMERRMKRLELILEEQKSLAEPKLYGNQDSEVLLVGWGSTKGAILTVLDLLQQEGKELAFLHFNWLWPFPAQKVIELMHQYKKVIMIENNYTGQLEGLIQQFTGLAMEDHIRKYDGRPFFPEELVELVRGKIQ